MTLISNPKVSLQSIDFEFVNIELTIKLVQGKGWRKRKYLEILFKKLNKLSQGKCEAEQNKIIK